MSNKASHEKLIAWQMADKLDIIVQEVLGRIPTYEYKTRKQIDTASDSIGSNIVEGYYSCSRKEFRRFLCYSRRSCAEVQERVRRVHRKKYIDDTLHEGFRDVCIKTGYIIDRLILSLEE